MLGATDGANNEAPLPVVYDFMSRADLTAVLMDFAEHHVYGRMLCSRGKIGFDDFDANATTADFEYLEKQRKANARVGFIFNSYHGKCWWYELLDLVRKLVLNGMMVFVGEGTAAQVPERPPLPQTCQLSLGFGCTLPRMLVARDSSNIIRIAYNISN